MYLYEFTLWLAANLLAGDIEHDAYDDTTLACYVALRDMAAEGWL